MVPQYERRPVTLLLDRVQSHHEIGEMFRLGEAFCVQRLVICGVRFNIHSRKLEKTAKGSQHNVPWTVADDAFAVIKAAKDFGLCIIVVVQGAAGIRTTDLRLELPALLVLSSEYMPRNQQIDDWADAVIRIPSVKAVLGITATAAIMLNQLAG